MSAAAGIAISAAETGAIVTVAIVGLITMRRRQRRHEEARDQDLTHLHAIETWLDLALKELHKADHPERASLTEPSFNYPSCPICRSDVFTFSSTDSVERDVVFWPCGCRVLIDSKTRRVVYVRPDEDNQ